MSEGAASGAAASSQAEAHAALMAAGAAEAERMAQIAAELEKHRATKARITEKYKGRSGRRNGADQAAFKRADSAIKDLESGEFPREANERRRLEAVAARKAREAASTTADRAADRATQCRCA